MISILFYLMYFTYAMIAKNSEVLEDFCVVQNNFREISLGILSNQAPGKEISIKIVHPCRFYCIKRADGTSYVSCCFSQISKENQEQFLLELETKWKAEVKRRNGLFYRFKAKIDFSSAAISDLLSRYNFETKERMKIYNEELSRQRKDAETAEKRLREEIAANEEESQRKFFEAFERGEELAIMERRAEIMYEARMFHRKT